MILELQIPDDSCRGNMNTATNFTDLVYGQQPSTHEAFIQCCLNAVPTSLMLAHYRKGIE